MSSKKSNNKSEKALEKQENKAVIEAYRRSDAFLTRSYNTIRTASLITAVATVATLPIYLGLAIFVNSIWFAITSALIVVAISFASVLLYVKIDAKRIRNSGYMLVITGLVAMIGFQILIGASNVDILGYPAMIMLAALAGVSVRGIITITLTTILFGTSMILAETFLRLYKPILSIADNPSIQLFSYPILMGVISGTVVLMVQSLYASLGSAEFRARQFQETNQLLARRNMFGSQVSQSLNSIVTELNTTSRQQANGAQEQAAAVMQVTSSLTELGETARHIANNAGRVSVAANDGLYSSNRVRESTQRASTTAGRGQTAVESSIQSIEEVRNGITALAERLMILTERSRQISSIIALIKEIADETHLLALNAAIESAGAGENGRRFNVVASEVKSLADRSLEATSEVSHIINELHGAVAAAVLSSEETRKKTFGAVERSYQAGQVINELGQVVHETAVSSIQIVEAVQQVATLAEEISLATQQQESASRQIIATMEAVGLVAQENASAVTQVSESVSRIDGLSSQLKEAFVTNSFKAAVV